MLKTMKFDEKFPCSWPKQQLFTIEKTKKSKRCTSQICSDMQNTGNSIKMVEIAYKQHYIHRHSRLENSFTNFLYLALHSIQNHIALQCTDSLIVQIIFFTEFCFSWTINEYVLPARAGSTCIIVLYFFHEIIYFIHFSYTTQHSFLVNCSFFEKKLFCTFLWIFLC